MVLLPGRGAAARQDHSLCQKSGALAGMDNDMDRKTRPEVLARLRRRCKTAGAEDKRKLLEVREKLLLASGRTLDRLLAPLRAQGAGRSLTPAAPSPAVRVERFWFSLSC